MLHTAVSSDAAVRNELAVTRQEACIEDVLRLFSKHDPPCALVAAATTTVDEAII